MGVWCGWVNAAFSNPEILSCGNGREKSCREKKTHINSQCGNREVMIEFLLLFTDNKITQWEDPRLQNPAITGPVSTAMVLFHWMLWLGYIWYGPEVLSSSGSCLFRRSEQTLPDEQTRKQNLCLRHVGGSGPALASAQGQGELPPCDSLPRCPKTDALSPAFKCLYRALDPVLLRVGWSVLGTHPACCQWSKAIVGTLAITGTFGTTVLCTLFPGQTIGLNLIGLEAYANLCHFMVFWVIRVPTLRGFQAPRIPFYFG